MEYQAILSSHLQHTLFPGIKASEKLQCKVAATKKTKESFCECRNAKGFAWTFGILGPNTLQRWCLVEKNWQFVVWTPWIREDSEVWKFEVEDFWMIHTFDDFCQLQLYRLLRKCCGPVDYFTIKSQIARNAQTFPKDSQPSALGDGSQLLSPTRATKHHPKTKAAWHGWHSMTTCTKTSKRGLLLVCPRNILIVYSYGDLGGIWRCLVRGDMYIYVYIHLIEVLCKYSKHKQHCKVMFDKLIWYVIIPV